MWRVSDETRIRRFLILGTTGGTYYQTEKELTMENVVELIEKGGGGGDFVGTYSLIQGREASC